MMKFVAVLALVLVAVSAKEKFKQPKMPCDFTLTYTGYEDGKKLAQYIIEINGRYLKIDVKVDGEKAVSLLRPDIVKDGKVTAFGAADGDCEVEEITEEEMKYVLAMYTTELFEYAGDKEWDHKESKKWRDKKCDHYYDDEKDSMEIYVYDGYLYGMVYDEDEAVFEYEWKAPMKDFVLSKKDYPKCYDKEKKVADTPSDDYVMCAASSVKIAFVAMLVALLAALF